MTIMTEQPSTETAAPAEGASTSPAAAPIDEAVSPTDKDVTPDSTPDSTEEAKAKIKEELDNDGSNEVPEAYNFGEGVDTEALAPYTEAFKELGLTNDQAKKLVDLRMKEAATEAESFTKIRSEWVEAAKADPEIGGDHFNQTVANAQAAVEKFGDDSFKQVLNEYGIGDHPAMIKFASKIGALLKEDTIVKGQPTQSKGDKWAQMYPDDKPNT